MVHLKTAFPVRFRPARTPCGSPPLDPLRVVAQPRHEPVEVEVIGFIKTHQKTIGVQIFELKPVSVDAEKCRRNSNGGSLIAVDKRMILGEALQQGRRFFDEVLIITRPGAGQAASRAPRSRSPGAPPKALIKRV